MSATNKLFRCSSVYDRFLITTIVLLVVFLCVGLSWDYLPLRAGVQHEMFFDGGENKTSMDYLLFLPQDYYKNYTSWPLLLYLHGAGERGNDLNKLKKYGPPMLVEKESDFPFILLSPQCPEDSNWEPDSLMALVEEVSKKYQVDKERISVTGFSMGGFGTWAMAAAYPERLAAAVPLSGGANPEIAQRLKNLPIWVFHGEKDESVPFESSQKIVDALKAIDANVKFTAYPNLGHDIPHVTYSNWDLYQWLLLQKRTSQ